MTKKFVEKNTDPLAEIITLLQPSPGTSKLVTASGKWKVSNHAIEEKSFYCLIINGECSFETEPNKLSRLCAGDFVLVPAGLNCAMASSDNAMNGPDDTPTILSNGDMRINDGDIEKGISYLVGHFEYGSIDAKMILSLLPDVIHISNASRLSSVVKLIIDESRSNRCAREVILARLLEVMFIEALRAKNENEITKSLVNGLTDARLAIAIRLMHSNLDRAWTIAQLAKEAGLSRSVFFDRFTQAVGLAPMEYLQNWRLASAKNMLINGKYKVSEIAERIGYGSASAFSLAFSRQVGMPPIAFARMHAA